MTPLIREKGYALDRLEGMPGIHCVAAPILDRNGRVAAITIAGPSPRIPEDEFDVIGEMVREGARQASSKFNHQYGNQSMMIHEIQNEFLSTTMS